MPIIVMKVFEAEPHPNAERLRVYTVGTEPSNAREVVANADHVYRVGDHVAVATLGTQLADGTSIKKARLRGVDSFGMLLGPRSEPEGTDVSAEFGCQEEPKLTQAPEVPLAKWASIELLHNVRTNWLKMKESGLPVPAQLTYRAKVKVDGTNAAVHVRPDAAVAQSRTRLLSPSDDNYGFAAWVERNSQYFAAVHAKAGSLILYGEWCGAGIQQRAAIARVPRQVLAVFAVVLGKVEQGTARIIVAPGEIESRLLPHPDILVLPWYGEPVSLPFSEQERLRAAADDIDVMVRRIAERDPWVADAFDVEGPGEGVVMYPVHGLPSDEVASYDRDSYFDWMFKAKGEFHRVKRQKSATELDPEVAKNVADFVEMFVTEARLQQALGEVCQGRAEPQLTSAFLRWMATDIRKECQDELEVAKLTWKDVAKGIGNSSQWWFRKQYEL